MAPVPRPTLELADIVRAAGDAYRSTHQLSLQQDRVLRAIANVSHGRNGGASLAMRPVRGDHHQLLLLPESPLPQVPNPGQAALAGTSMCRLARYRLLAPGIHVAPFAQCPCPGQSPGDLSAAVPRPPHKPCRNSGAIPAGSAVNWALPWSCTPGASGSTSISMFTPWSPAVPSDGDGERWIPAKPGFLFPVRALSKVFRAKYLDALAKAQQDGELRFAGSTAALTDIAAFHDFLVGLKAKDWVVYAKPPFAGAAQVLAYLGRYTHRVAIANHRLVSFEDGEVRFRWRDYAHGNKKKIMTLSARRVPAAISPAHAPTRVRADSPLWPARQSLPAQEYDPLPGVARPVSEPEPSPPESVEAMMLRLTGNDIQRCPVCQRGRLRVIEVLEPAPTFPPNPKATGPPQCFW